MFGFKEFLDFRKDDRSGKGMFVSEAVVNLDVGGNTGEECFVKGVQ